MVDNEGVLGQMVLGTGVSSMMFHAHGTMASTTSAFWSSRVLFSHTMASEFMAPVVGQHMGML
jgi:hypothetical protein